MIQDTATTRNWLMFKGSYTWNCFIEKYGRQIIYEVYFILQTISQAYYDLKCYIFFQIYSWSSYFRKV